MSWQIRVQAGPPIAAALRATGGEFPTGRLNAIAERYLAMIEEARPALSRDEWLAIFDALNGVGAADEIIALEHMRATWDTIAAEIASTPGLGQRWNIDAADLAQRVYDLPQAGKIAIIETAQRFWALAHLPDSQALDLATQHPAGWPKETER